MNKRKNAIGYILVIVIIALMAVYPIVAPDFGVKKINEVARIIFNTILGIGGAIVMKMVYGTEFKFKGIKDLKVVFGIWGLVFLPAAVLNLLGDHQVDLTFVQALPSFLISMLTGILAGLSEELIFRGACFNVFRERFGEGRGGILLSVVLSSALFGVLHLTNLMTHPYLVIYAGSQAIYATLFGISFACAYYVTGSIWAVIILHAIVDCAAFFWGCFSKQAGGEIFPSQDIPLSAGVTSVVIFSFFAAFGLILLFRNFKKRGI